MPGVMSIEIIRLAAKGCLRELDLEYLILEVGRTGLEKQCQERFGATWDEISAQVFRDLDSASRWSCNVSDFGASNWMITPLISVWTLDRWYASLRKKISLSQQGFGGERDMRRAVNEMTEGKIQVTQRELLYIAPYLVEDDTKRLLASYGRYGASNLWEKR